MPIRSWQEIREFKIVPVLREAPRHADL